MAAANSRRPAHCIERALPGTLASLLTDHLEDVANAVLLAPVVRVPNALRGSDRNGDDWLIRLAGAKRGLCLCTTRPVRSGDPLVLVIWARYAGDRGAAIAWTRDYLQHTIRSAA